MSLKSLYDTTIKDGLAWRIASGALRLPAHFLEQGVEFYDFPPALIPIWREEWTMIGFWHHWFCENRSTTIVAVDPEFGFKTTIKANSLSQLLIDFVYRMARIDEELSPFMEKFILDLNLGDPQLIRESLAYSFGDPRKRNVLQGLPGDPPTFLDMKFFERFAQAISINDGDLSNFCALEFNTREIQGLKDRPPWMEDVDKPKLFQGFLKKVCSKKHG